MRFRKSERERARENRRARGKEEKQISQETLSRERERGKTKYLKRMHCLLQCL